MSSEDGSSMEFLQSAPRRPRQSVVWDPCSGWRRTKIGDYVRLLLRKSSREARAGVSAETCGCMQVYVQAKAVPDNLLSLMQNGGIFPMLEKQGLIAPTVPL